MIEFRDAALSALTATALQLAAAPASAQSQGAGERLFTGCDDNVVLPVSADNPRQRMMEAASKVDPITERVFRSFSLEEAAEVDADEFDTACWSRLDGIWREQSRVSFDKSTKAEGWASEDPSMLEFAHGSYTTPLFIIVHPAADYNRSITIQSALGPGEPVQFKATDSVPVTDVLTRKVRRKNYQSGTFSGRNATLKLDVTASSYMRIRLGDRSFLRPRPDISKAARGEQVPITDIFAIAYNPKNMRANRQSYDITAQNPNRFLDNGGKLNVFAPATPRDYYITEQMTVPLGLKLIEEGSQGNVYFETLLSSESSIQESTRSSFGVNAGFTSSKPDSGGKNNSRRDDKEDASFGYSHAKEQFNALSESSSVSTISGYQRYKKYALVRDHPYSELSADFVDAIADVQETGNYSYLLDKFGTHYPYAVTYGSSGKLTTYMTQDKVAQTFGNSEQSSTSAGIKVGPLDFSANMASAKDLKQGSTVETRYGTTTFSAVGGNGSWNENGFVAGDAPYPILMDLRALDELLNPMYFSNQPDIYDRVRLELGATISAYLVEKGGQLRTASLLRKLEPVETWVLRTQLRCDGGGHESDNQLELAGTITVTPESNPRGATVRPMTPVKSTMDKPIFVACNKGIRPVGKGQTITGKLSQLSGVGLRVKANMTELDYAGVFDPDDTVAGQSPVFGIPRGPIGRKVQGSWAIPNPDGAALHFIWILKRTK